MSFFTSKLWVCILFSWVTQIHAQSSASICSGPSITIKSETDAMNIASCNQYTGDITIDRSVSGKIDLSGVTQITGDLTARNVRGLTSLAAPALSTVGGTLDVGDMAGLDTLSFPLLTAITNGLNITNAPKIEIINGFPRLRTVGGAIHFEGDFDSFALPSIRNITGNVNLTSSSANQTMCTILTAAARLSVIKGNVTCALNATIPSLADPDTGSGVRVGRIVGIVVGVVVGLLLVATVVAWFAYFRPRRQRKSLQAASEQDPHRPGPYVPMSEPGRGASFQPVPYYAPSRTDAQPKGPVHQIQERSELDSLTKPQPKTEGLGRHSEETTEMYSPHRPRFDSQGKVSQLSDETSEMYSAAKTHDEPEPDLKVEDINSSSTSQPYGSARSRLSGLALHPVHTRLINESTPAVPQSASSVYSDDDGTTDHTIGRTELEGTVPASAPPSAPPVPPRPARKFHYPTSETSNVPGPGLKSAASISRKPVPMNPTTTSEEEVTSPVSPVAPPPRFQRESKALDNIPEALRPGGVSMISKNDSRLVKEI